MRLALDLVTALAGLGFFLVVDEIWMRGKRERDLCGVHAVAVGPDRPVATDDAGEA